MIFVAVVSRLSAGCRWRPSTSACLRSTLPSLSCCRRTRTPAHTPWSWSCRSWEITVTGVSRCAVSCLGVHLCVCGKTGVPFKEAFDLSFMIHPNRRGICIQHCYCTSWVIVCVCHGASVKHYHLNFSINSKFLLFFFYQMSQKSSNVITSHELWQKNAVRSFRYLLNTNLYPGRILLLCAAELPTCLTLSLSALCSVFSKGVWWRVFGEWWFRGTAAPFSGKTRN